jgi:RimJ/RimL family protein N-acetyltransferase
MRLVRPGPALLDAAVAGDEPLAAALGHAVVPGWATFRGALEHTRDTGVGDPRWGPCFFVAGEPPALVGWGGYKGPPDADGTVEIGYEIAASCRGRGLATDAARTMVTEAFADPAVHRVIAHTLPEHNASNHILRKLGFVFAGDALDRDTPAWRWSAERAGSS